MRILLVAHGFPPQANAGAETYVYALAQALRNEGDAVTVFTREFDPSRPDLSVRREARDRLELVWLNNGFRDCRSLEDTYRNASIRALFGRLLNEVRPDVVHLHHLTGLSTDLVFELHALGIPSVLTLHDFWLICQRGQLLDLELRRCAGPAPAACARCLHSDVESADRRIAHVREVLDRVTLLLCPSETLRRRFVEFGVQEERLRIHELGIDLTPFGARSPVSPGPLRVAFVGSVMVSKAPHLLLEAAAGLPEGAIELSLAGAYSSYHGDDGYRAILDAARSRVAANFLGEISREEVIRLLLRTDVLVLPSVWLENSPLVIKEAFAAGVPVVASDLGGMAEAVRHEESGLLFASGDVGALRGTLRRLLDESGLLDRLRRGLPRVRPIEADVWETRELYLGLKHQATKETGARLPRSFWPFGKGSRPDSS